MTQPGITDVVLPRKVLDWKEFKRIAPPYSIALDGIVYGKTCVDARTHHANFNHHEEVDRFSTHATCGILQIYIKTGLFDHFRVNGIPTATLYLNDPDQDSSLSRWMMYNHERVKKGEPLLNKLIFAEDILDVTGGIFPLGLESELMANIAWIFEPYTASIHNLHHMKDKQMITVMDAIGSRIDSYLMGRSGRIVPDDRFDVMHDYGRLFKMVHEIGPYARTRLYEQGTTFMVSYRGEDPKGTHRYSLAKLSPFGPEDMEFIFDQLNCLEHINADDKDRWGGGNAYGGSPRLRGSKIDPDRLCDELAGILKGKK
ncbi:MAG TPA: hypothetical protein VK158_01515 [Acidobacteriota bacterium]|nr:hypothetical protein [Acidobacteriota bacterium]